MRVKNKSNTQYKKMINTIVLTMFAHIQLLLKLS